MVQQNGHSHNGFAPSPIVDAPYAMRPKSDGAVAYPPCPSDYEPAPAPKATVPSWQDQLAACTHQLRWADHDGHEHSLTIRADDLDTLLIQLRTVKCFIAASKAKAQPAPCTEPQAPPVEPEPEPEDHEYCSTHGRAQLRPSRYGGVFCSARMKDGSFCKFKSKRDAKR